MNIFNKLFGIKSNKVEHQSFNKNQIKVDTFLKENLDKNLENRGVVSTNKIEIYNNTIDLLKEKFIAFDIETTGLSPYNDRIIEVGAVLFEKGLPVKKFGSLINPMVNIKSAATAVNHINNQMIENAPKEREVYESLITFLGDSLDEGTVICAHNARFDIDFLSETLSRLGYNAKINYIDTLSLSRRLINGLKNYKQDTIASYFNLYNQNSHRAVSDAEICGYIFFRLLEIMNEEKEKNKIEMEKSKPSEDELEVCAYIQNIIALRNGDTNLIGFYKNSSGYVDVSCVYNVIKFKFAKKGKYIIVSKDLDNIEDCLKEPCTVSEGGADNFRLFFNSPLDLEIVADYIYEKYKIAYKSAREYLDANSKYMLEYQNSPIMYNALSIDKVKNILDNVNNKNYDINNSVKSVELAIDRASIEIHPINNRVPVLDILNLNNWEKGFDAGYPLWEEGEKLRKEGNIEQAIELFDKARFNGYCAPALFESYAKAFRKIKDYDNEIDILDECISRTKDLKVKTGPMISRRNKAIKLLLNQRENTKKN